MRTAWAGRAAPAVLRTQGYDERGNHPGSDLSMLNIGTPELLVILIIALLVVGPQRLPELSRQLGRGLREFRKIQDDVKDMVKVDLDAPDAPPSAPAGSPMAPGVHRTRRPGDTDGSVADGNGAQDGAPPDGHAPAG
jgi:Tat protein translocase TatB subunit